VNFDSLMVFGFTDILSILAELLDETGSGPIPEPVSMPVLEPISEPVLEPVSGPVQ